MKRPTYSTYEAKARFSELLRQVRGGTSVFITYRGDEVAEIRPISSDETVEAKLERLEKAGVLVRATEQGSTKREGLRPLARSSGALERFLESRD